MSKDEEYQIDRATADALEQKREFEDSRSGSNLNHASNYMKAKREEDKRNAQNGSGLTADVELSAKLVAVQRDVEDLQEAINFAVDEADILGTDISAVIYAAEQKMSENNDMIVALQQEFDAIEPTHSIMSAKLDSFDTKIADLETDINRRIEIATAIYDETYAISKEMEVFGQIVMSAKMSDEDFAEKALDKLKEMGFETLKDAEKHYEDLRANTGDGWVNLEGSVTEINSLQANKDALVSVANSLRANVNALEKRLNDIPKHIKALQDNNFILKNGNESLAELGEKTARIRAQLDEVKNDTQTLLDEISSGEITAEDALEKLEALDAKATELQEQLTAYGQDFAQQNKNINDSNAETDRVIEEIDQDTPRLDMNEVRFSLQQDLIAKIENGDITKDAYEDIRDRIAEIDPELVTELDKMILEMDVSIQGQSLVASTSLERDGTSFAEPCIETNFVPRGEFNRIANITDPNDLPTPRDPSQTPTPGSSCEIPVGINLGGGGKG